MHREICRQRKRNRMSRGELHSQGHRRHQYKTSAQDQSLTQKIKVIRLQGRLNHHTPTLMSLRNDSFKARFTYRKISGLRRKCAAGRTSPNARKIRTGGEFGAEPSPRRRHPRHTRANCGDRTLPVANRIALNPPRAATKPSQTKPKENRRSDTQIESTLNPKRIALEESSAPNPLCGDDTFTICEQTAATEPSPQRTELC